MRKRLLRMWADIVRGGMPADDIDQTNSDTLVRRSPIRWLILCGVALIAAIAIGTTVTVVNFRERALTNSERELENTVLLLTHHFDQKFEDSEIMANHLISEMQLSQTRSSADLWESPRFEAGGICSSRSMLHAYRADWASHDTGSDQPKNCDRSLLIYVSWQLPALIPSRNLTGNDGIWPAEFRIALNSLTEDISDAVRATFLERDQNGADLGQLSAKPTHRNSGEQHRSKHAAIDDKRPH